MYIKVAQDCSDKLKNLNLLFTGNNFKGALSDNELQNYYSLCQILIKNEFNLYLKELEGIFGLVNENNTDDIALIQKIQSYPSQI